MLHTATGSLKLLTGDQLREQATQPSLSFHFCDGGMWVLLPLRPPGGFALSHGSDQPNILGVSALAYTRHESL